ncbi:MAG: hypothetical protein K2N17_00455 [Clostridia bacterium]|nr:hypothetical protein [Clostridia bacterium]
MEENENVVVEEQQATPTKTVVEETAVAASEPKKESFGAKIKEWFRKQAVTLKRKPQRIAFLFFIISSVMYLIGLNVFSPGPVIDFPSQSYLGLSVFVTTLFSILVLVLFMNTFPKRGIKYKKTGKKHNMNYIMLALTFVFVIVMFLMDLLYYKQLTGCINGNEAKFFLNAEQAAPYAKYFTEDAANLAYDAGSYKSYLVSALHLDIAHMVFLGISAVLLATLPLYKKLILKINTSKVVESTEIKEVIDTEDE